MAVSRTTVCKGLELRCLTQWTMSHSPSIRWHALLSFLIYDIVWLFYLHSLLWRWLTFRGNAWKLVCDTVLGSKFIAFCQISHLRGGDGGGGNVWIARSVCSYWFRCRDIHDSLWLKHCIQCLDRDIASEVGISMTIRMTATCPQSRDESPALTCSIIWKLSRGHDVKLFGS